MASLTASATAHPNIAFIKYWGNRDAELRLPSNGSISMNLDSLFTHTRVKFDPGVDEDRLSLNGQEQDGVALQRVSKLLDRVRKMAYLRTFAVVDSENNFPTGAGIASSASAFAALSVAASKAAGLELSESELSRLARTGSGSACRSIPSGFVEWRAAERDRDSFAFSIALPEHWDLVDCIAIISSEHKTTGSSDGHALASSSPVQSMRVADAPRRIDICRKAILERDFDALAQMVEQDCHIMHAVMMTSTPPLLYWQPATLGVMQKVLTWRAEGLAVCYTIDAGANVHVLCPAPLLETVVQMLEQVEGVKQIFAAHPGGAVQIGD